MNPFKSDQSDSSFKRIIQSDLRTASTSSEDLTQNNDFVLMRIICYESTELWLIPTNHFFLNSLFQWTCGMENYWLFYVSLEFLDPVSDSVFNSVGKSDSFQLLFPKMCFNNLVN